MAGEAADVPRVLIIDADEPHVSKVKSSLEGHCVDIVSTPCSSQALDIIDELKVPVVICALHLPDCNGVETLARIKEKHPKTVRAIMTWDVDWEHILPGMMHDLYSRCFDKSLPEHELRKAILSLLKLSETK